VVSKLIGSSAVTDRHMCAAARRVVTVWARRAMQGGYWIGETPCNVALFERQTTASADHPTRAKSRNSNAADWLIAS
jgi:hypothetical protein